MRTPRYSTGVLNALTALAGTEPVAVTVRGDCMAPLLRSGQRVLVKRCRLLLPGDVVAVHDGTQILVHRFIGAWPSRRGWKYVTRADAALDADTAVTTDRLLGQVLHAGAQAPLGVTLRMRVRSLLRFALLCLRRGVHRLAA